MIGDQYIICYTYILIGEEVVSFFTSHLTPTILMRFYKLHITWSDHTEVKKPEILIF